MIIHNPYWIIKCADVTVSLSFPQSFDHSGFCKVWHSLRRQSSRLGEPKCSYEKKSCPACHGYPTCRAKITRPPELSRVPSVPRQLGVIQLNGCINFTTTQGKVNSPRVTRGRVVSGTRDHINGTLDSHPVCFLCILIGQFPLRDMPAGNHGSFINWNKYPVQDDE